MLLTDSPRLVHAARKVEEQHDLQATAVRCHRLRKELDS
jgi:hypothetical protein